MHLLNPSAPHHWRALQPAAVDDEEPAIDVVFVHGIRGGPFVTWRKGRVTEEPRPPAVLPHASPMEDPSASPATPPNTAVTSSLHLPSWLSSSSSKPSQPQPTAVNPPAALPPITRTSHLSMHACWPTSWMSEDAPTARLLTVEFPAPYTSWEVR